MSPTLVLEHRPHHRAQRLHVEPQWRVGKRIAELVNGSRQRGHWIHDVHYDRQLGLKPLRNGSRLRLEIVHSADNEACLCKQRSALLGQARIAAAPVEQLHIDLFFEVCKCLAHDGLRPAQPSAGGGEAAFVCCGNEGVQLIQGYAIQHVSIP